MSPEEVLRSPTPRLWVLLNNVLEVEKHLLKNVYGNVDIVEQEEFGEEWEKKTSPPEWWLKKQKEQSKKERIKEHMWNND